MSAYTSDKTITKIWEKGLKTIWPIFSSSINTLWEVGNEWVDENDALFKVATVLV